MSGDIAYNAGSGDSFSYVERFGCLNAKVGPSAGSIAIPEWVVSEGSKHPERGSTAVTLNVDMRVGGKAPEKGTKMVVAGNPSEAGKVQMLVSLPGKDGKNSYMEGSNSRISTACYVFAQLGDGSVYLLAIHHNQRGSVEVPAGQVGMSEHPSECFLRESREETGCDLNCLVENKTPKILGGMEFNPPLMGVKDVLISLGYWLILEHLPAVKGPEDIREIMSAEWIHIVGSDGSPIEKGIKSFSIGSTQNIVHLALEKWEALPNYIPSHAKAPKEERKVSYTVPMRLG